MTAGLCAQNSVVLDKVSSSDMTGSFITAISSDNKGYLWVGTSNGLNRYDGYNFNAYRSYKNDSLSLIHPSIRCIKQYFDEELLIGTSGGMCVYLFEKNHFKRTKIDSTLQDIKKKRTVNCFAQLKNGQILAGTSSGVMLFDRANNRLLPYSINSKLLLEGTQVQSMCVDRNGDIWFGTKKVSDTEIKFRVYKLSVAGNMLREFVVSEYGSSGHVGISEDYRAGIWVAVDDGLVNIDPKSFKQTFYKAPNGFLSNTSYFHSKDNYIYQGFWSFGVTVFDIDKKEFYIIKNEADNTRSLLSNKVWAFYKDENDVAWFGTDVGLQKQSSKRANFEVIKRNAELGDNTFSSNQLMSVWQSRFNKNKVLVSVDGDGIAVYDKLQKKSLSVHFGVRSEGRIEDRFVQKFHETKEGVIYASGQYNFERIDLKNDGISIKHYFFTQQHHFTDVFEDFQNKDVLWIGSLGQIVKFTKSTETFEFIEKPANWSNFLFSGISLPSGTYFTSQSALLKINGSGSKIITIQDAGNIIAVEALNNDHLLLGSSYLGLLKFDIKTNTYEIIRNAKNDFFNEINCIKKVKNNIWIGTNVGLYRYFPNSNEIMEYSVLDGLPSNIIKSIDYFEGYLYLATANGLVIINPGMHSTHFSIPKLDITSVIGIGNDLEIISNLNGKTIEIPEGKNSFKINFTVLDFNLPEKNSYRYKLLPSQKEWKNNLNDHTVSFNELNVGEYEFLVIGANSDNTWNTEPVSIKIKIVPPFYRSNTFYILLGLMVLIITAAIFYVRYKRNIEIRKYLENTIEQRTEEIRQKQLQLERANTELMDSITYAQKIQKTLLVGEQILTNTLPESFIYFQPKAKVSGDFFFIGKENGYLIVVAADCTGHGVPGAMLSVVGTTLLNKIVYEENIYLPGNILSRLNHLFYAQLNAHVDEHSPKDGMDISVITINLNDKKMFFSGARNNGAMFKDGNLTEFVAQRESIGESDNVNFETIEVSYDTDATYYLYSDGFKDQFGGPQYKKLNSKVFKKVLANASKLEMNGQRTYLKRFVNDWQGEVSQTDDRMVIGFKLP